MLRTDTTGTEPGGTGGLAGRWNARTAHKDLV